MVKSTKAMAISAIQALANAKKGEKRAPVEKASASEEESSSSEEDSPEEEEDDDKEDEGGKDKGKSGKGRGKGGKGGKGKGGGKRGGKGGGQHVKAFQAFRAVTGRVREKTGTVRSNPPIATMLAYGDGPLSTKQLAQLPPANIKTTVPLHVVKTPRALRPLFLSTPSLLENVLEITEEQLYNAAKAVIGGSFGTAAILFFKGNAFSTGKLPQLMDATSHILLSDDDIRAPFRNEMDDLLAYTQEHELCAREEEAYGLRVCHLHNTLATLFNSNKYNSAVATTAAFANVRRMALASVTNILNAAHKRGAVLLPKNFYIGCLTGLLDEGEVWKGEGEPAVDFLQVRGGRLEWAFVNAILADPKETEAGFANPLSYLFLPVLSLVNRGRQILEKSSECFKRPEGGGFSTWEEDEDAPSYDPAMHGCNSSSSMPPKGVFFIALLCMIHWIRSRERQDGLKLGLAFSEKSFTNLNTLWKALGRWYTILPDEFPDWEGLESLEDFCLRQMEGDEGEEGEDSEELASAYMSPVITKSKPRT